MTDNETKDRSTEGMVDYNENSQAQQQNALCNSEIIADLAARVSAHSDVLNITDYGCGSGQSAIDTISPALDVWQANAAGKSIAVCHADQPGNDWNALMSLVFGEGGYMRGTNAPLVQTSVGSFYERVTADQSVSLATCFAASHWLSTAVRFHAPDTIWFADLTGPARETMWQQAERDWVRFLQLRAEELRSGGYLLVSTLGAVPEPGEINGTAASGRGIYRALQAVTADMAADGILDQRTADTFLFGLWFLTAEEARRPIEDSPELRRNYEIEAIEVRSPENGSDLFSAYLSDPADYARHYTGYTRAFSSTSLRSQLFQPSATDKFSVDELEKEFFQRFEALYRENTTQYAFEQWFLRVILRRK